MFSLKETLKNVTHASTNYFLGNIYTLVTRQSNDWENQCKMFFGEENEVANDDTVTGIINYSGGFVLLRHNCDYQIKGMFGHVYEEILFTNK